ncbi:hypothetical protein AB0L06_05540 [Spirillospora sp. NPDC052269]
MTLGTLLLLGLASAAIVLTVRANAKEKPRDTLLKAASALANVHTLTYSGTIGSASATLVGKLKVTKGGRAYGPVTWNGTAMTLLAADGHVFLKESKSSWVDRLQLNTTAAALVPDGDKWSSIDPDDLGLDFKGSLSPPGMAALMRGHAGQHPRRSETTARGREAIKISVSGVAFYISRTGGHELLRYESSVPKIAADVTAQPVSAGPATVADMMADIGRLGDAFDATRAVKADAKPVFTSCEQFGRPCTVSLKVQPDPDTSGQARIRAYFRLSSQENGGGKVFGDCRAEGVVPAGQGRSLRCTFSGGEWAKHGSEYTRVWVRVLALQLAIGPQDVPGMQHELAAE